MARVICNTCTPDRRGNHQPGCPNAPQPGDKGKKKGSPSDGSCPEGGKHEIRYGKWMAVNGLIHQRLMDCKKCEADLGYDRAGHNWKRATCSDCGRTRVEPPRPH